MDSINAVRKNLFECRKVHGVSIAVQEEDVIRINLPDGLLNPFIEGLEANVRRIRGLIQWVISCNL
jgi:transcription antitermination factor NusA-like protein